jgi:hypothetical protein
VRERTRLIGQIPSNIDAANSFVVRPQGTPFPLPHVALLPGRYFQAEVDPVLLRRRRKIIAPETPPSCDA